MNAIGTCYLRAGMVPDPERLEIRRRLREYVHLRAEALKQLQHVADFFRRTEPHSPVSYLVQRAARWGQMPLEEWLQEVIKNADVLGEVKETLGLAKDSTTTSVDS